MAFSGASESEQLPGTTEVIPCSSAGFAAPSHSSWTSKCVCGSMKPGATTWPLASITRLRLAEIGADRGDAAVLDRDVRREGRARR